MKLWSVCAFFPEVRPAHLADQSCVVKAASLGAAARRGFEAIRARPELSGKRIGTARLTVRLIGEAGAAAPVQEKGRERSRRAA